MPYKSNEVGKVKEDIPSLKNFSDSKVRQFIKIFNSLLKDGMAEKQAIPLAISQINKSLINKATTESVSKDDAGNLVYRGNKFPGYNKPIKDSGDKQGKVLAKKGDEIKVVRFGDPSMPDNQSVEANDRFYARFGGQDGMDDKFSPLYWSAKWLWPKGGMKGKGAKEFHTLKKSAENNVSKDFIKSLTSLITKHFGDSNPSIREITKFNEEEMVAIEPLYCGVGEVDLHEEGMTEEEIRKMVDNINENIENIHGNIGHVFNTDGFYFVKAWVNECECKIGDEVVLEGQPIIKVQFTDKSLWEHRKSGKLQGLSIGALGLKEENPDYEGDESDE